MKVVHIESGLGNQMLSYCEYLVLKKLHPDENIYIETIIYDIPEANGAIKQWNGYELERIFSIHAPNVKDLFTEEQWTRIENKVKVSEFWLKNWNYPVYITKALNDEGLHLRNIRGDFEAAVNGKNVDEFGRVTPTERTKLIDTWLGSMLRRAYRVAIAKKRIRNSNSHDVIFYKGNDDVFTGQWLGLKHRDAGIEFVDKELRTAFTFPDWDSDKNRNMAEMLRSVNSVAIHARRGDMLGGNGYCYKYGYFRRAVKYIKKHVENPVFVFFSDPGSVDWCRENADIFNLDFNRDKVYFVDWNKGVQSFRDMQLIAQCKHAIITTSSFGWWGAYFISNQDKITISPDEEITVNTTYHC